MRVRRADEAALERALIDVVREAAAPAQQSVVLDPLHGSAEPASRHLLSSTARLTARRIEA